MHREKIENVMSSHLERTGEHLYRVAFQFYARDQAEAMEIIGGSFQDAPKITLTIEDLDRRRMWIQALKWGGVIGLLAASFALWCIAEGWWTR